MGFTAVLLTFAVIFVNGLTDAPNAVATCVSSRAIKLKYALFISASFNFLGVFTSYFMNNAVTDTIVNMVNFGADNQKASVALGGALFSIVLWAVIAWFFGIPTSESHALIAGLTGSALAINGSFSGINPEEWVKSIYGLLTSCGGGFIAGYLVCRTVVFAFRNTKRFKATAFFNKAQIFSAICMSFMHGAQDGQKFIALLHLCLKYSGIQSSDADFFIILLCSAVMGMGTLFGGKRIIKSIGIDMMKTEKYQGFSADFAASVSLLFSTIWGFPVSTTHAKTTAMIGTAFAKSKKALNKGIIKNLFSTWVFTFPGCGIIGFFITKLFLKIF